MMRRVVAQSLLTASMVLLGGIFMLTPAQAARNEWVTIKVVFCSDAVSPKLVSEYTGARLLSFQPPVARFAVPKHQYESYGLLFETLPYTRLTDPALRQRVRALHQHIAAEPADHFAAHDPNTLIVRFKQPDDKLLQEFALIFNVSVRQFVAPLELALIEVPEEQARLYYTVLRHAPQVSAVDFNTTNSLF